MVDWLTAQAQRRPTAPALFFAGQSWGYREMQREAQAMAARLAALEVTPGQRVALLLPNRPAVLFLIHAVARLGAVLVPLNVRLSPTELAWQLQQSESRVLICGRETEMVAAPLGASGVRVASVDHSPLDGVVSLPQVAEVPLPMEDQAQEDLKALQGIVYTSGTTGHPKGAMLTFHNYLWSAAASAFRLGSLPDDRWLACMPLYHVGGLSIVMRCCLAGSAVDLHQGFDVAAVKQALTHEQVTLVSLVPTMLQRLLDSWGEAPVPPHLRAFLLGGAAAPVPLVQRALAAGFPVALTYGLTEATSQVATALPEAVARKPGSVGQPLLGSRVWIADPTGGSLPAGEIGEVIVAGPTIMAGYYRQPEATAAALQHGAFATGDLGYLDEDGDLWLVQRRSDLIVSGGENVYPAEVERVLAQHPAVAEACVVGLPDPEWGQRVAAAVVLAAGMEATPEALQAFCRLHLAGYKQPRRYCFVTELPRTASGKIQRAAVVALFNPPEHPPHAPPL